MLGFRQLDLSLGQKLALSSSIRRSSDGQVVANQTHFWSEIRKGLGDTSLGSVWPKSPKGALDDMHMEANQPYF